MSGPNAQLPNYRHIAFGDHNSVRLLSLQPGRADDVLRITLQEKALDQLPKFEALSYAWESQTPQCPVLCGKAQLLITKNCFAALRRLRLKRRERLLWIDSICIDQNSTAERERQVQLMGDVYSKALGVMIWLGEGTELSDYAMDYMIDCNKIRSSTWQKPARGLLLARKERAIIEMEKQLVQNDRSWEDLMKSVFTRSWFTRIWAIQEYVLSRNAVFKCGCKELNSAALFSEFREFEARVYERLDPASHYKSTRLLENPNYTFPIAAYIQHFEELRSTMQNTTTGTSLSVTDLLINARMQVATYPKDAVFGMFGILQKFKLAMPLPSHTDSVEDLYSKIAQAAIEHDSSLSILLEAGQSKTYPNLPSWCPDWNATPTHALSHASTSGFLMNFEASENTAHSYQFMTDGRVLRVSGVVVDVVTSLSDFHVPGEVVVPDPYKAHLASREALRDSIFFARSMSPYPTAEPWKYVLRKTLLSDRSMVVYEKPTGYDTKQEIADFEYWLDSLQVGIKSRTETGTSHSSSPRPEPIARLSQAQDSLISLELGKRPSALAFEEMVYNEVAGLRLFRTSAGYLGKTIPSLNQGDVVILISGLPIPMIARATGETYKLIGPSYIHGIMEGERWPHDETDLIDLMLS